MKRSRTAVNAVILAVFAALCVAGMEYLAINIGQPNPLGSGYTLHAVFSDADGIPTAADVRVAGIVVGKVTEISHDPSQPGYSVVTMELSDSRAVPVYTNGHAVIRPKTLLGEKYVDLTVGSRDSAAPIDNGGYLAVGSTGKDVSNDEIFNAFDAQTRKEQQQVLDDLNVATQDRAANIQAEIPDLQKVFADLSPLAQMYSQDQPQVDHILTQLNTILQTTADENQQLAGLFHNGNVALTAIAQRDGSLMTTLQEAANVASEFNAAAAPEVQAQRQAIEQLAPTLKDENTFLNYIVGPQPGCGNKPCGIDELFTGTLTGNINYPNDQLTVTSPDGSTVAEEWDSMFSNQPDAYRHPGAGHAALNLVLSFHCDTMSTMLNEIAPMLTQQQITAIETACQTAIFHQPAGGQ